MKQFLRLQNLESPGAEFWRKLCSGKSLSFALSLFVLFVSNPLLAQPTFIVGTGTSSSSTASIFSTSTTSNNYSKNIAIYSAADILAAGGYPGAITKIAWQKGGSGEYIGNDIQLTVSMKAVTFTQHAASTITYATEIAGATQVYTSTTETFITGNGWNEINLQTPFLWDGTSNIEVFVEFYRPGTPTASINWLYTTKSNANSSQVSGTAPTTTSRNGNLPNIRLAIIPATPCTAPPAPGTATASATSVCAGATFNLDVTGATFGSGQTFQWETSTTGAAPWTSVGTGGISPTLTTTQTAGTHFYRAAVTCSGQTAYSTPVSVTSPALVTGTFTIDKNNPASATNFQTFASALSSLSCGIGGPVTFNVVAGSGPYNEQVTISPVPGASATNTITFNGNGNTISASPVSGTRHIFKLDDADFITINNFMIATDAAATYGWGIHVLNGADNNTISNNTITIGTSSTTASNSGGIIFANSTSSATTVGNTGNNNVISNNTITGGYRGIRINSAAANTGNNQITGNTITDFYSAGIEIDDANGTLIQNNNISRPTRAAVTTFEGITLSGTTKSTVVSKNRIHDSHTGATTKTGSAYGVYSTANDAPVGSENIVSNNLIYNFTNTGTTYGVYNSSSDGVFYYHNTISLDNPAATGNNRGIYQTTAASNIKFINNIVSITSGAPFASQRAVYFNAATSGITSNNNVLYVPNGAMGYFDGVTYATLADWQTANPTAPFDANSVTANPRFVNAAAGNFQPTAFAVNNIGQPVAAVTTDITGAARPATSPDPGAYEFSLPANDVGVTAITTPVSGCSLTASQTITITVFNFGTAAQSNVPVSYTLNGGTPVTATIPGPIAPGASVTYTFSTPANLSAPGPYTLTVTSGLAGDALAYNDAITTTIHNAPVISTFPYNEGFENGNGNWIASGRNSSWALGTPAATIINTAGGGTNSWVTNLTGNHNAFESSAVTSPCFNFTTLPNPIISMKIWWSIEDDWDGAVLQSSIDGGATWQVVGDFGDPNNWYNADSIDANPGNQPLSQNGRFIGWSGTGTASSGGWVTASHALTGLGGLPNVRLRIAFASDLFTEEEGFAFDDIFITTALTTPTIAAGGPTTFCQGDSVILTATSIPGATFAWELNGTPIAGATSSTLTANASGSYTVVATSGASNATSAPTVITVNPAPATPVITQNGGTLTSSAASGNQWYLNGTAIAGATGQTHVTTTNGAYTVIVTGANSCESEESAVVNVTNTGIKDALAGMNVSIYPNPNNGSFNVKLTGYQQDATLSLYSLTGQLIATEKVKAGQEGKQMKLKNLASGTYLLQVISEKGTQVSRLIVE